MYENLLAPTDTVNTKLCNMTPPVLRKSPRKLSWQKKSHQNKQADVITESVGSWEVRS